MHGYSYLGVELSVDYARGDRKTADQMRTRGRPSRYNDRYDDDNYHRRDRRHGDDHHRRSRRYEDDDYRGDRRQGHRHNRYHDEDASRRDRSRSGSRHGRGNRRDYRSRSRHDRSQSVSSQRAVQIEQTPTLFKREDSVGSRKSERVLKEGYSGRRTYNSRSRSRSCRSNGRRSEGEVDEFQHDS